MESCVQTLGHPSKGVVQRSREDQKMKVTLLGVLKCRSNEDNMNVGWCYDSDPGAKRGDRPSKKNWIKMMGIPVNIKERRMRWGRKTSNGTCFVENERANSRRLNAQLLQ